MTTNTELKVQNSGEFTLKIGSYNASASFPLFIIRAAWHKGCEVEDLADGFGPGLGTNGDWSAIRDSSPEAIEEMLARALDFLGLLDLEKSSAEYLDNASSGA